MKRLFWLAAAVTGTLIGGGLLGGGCSSEPSPPHDTCGLSVWYKATHASSVVEVVGSWDGWKRPGRFLMADRSDGWRQGIVDVPPGRYSYAIVDDGKWQANPSVGTTSLWEGREVTWVDTTACREPALRVTSARGIPGELGTLDLVFQPGAAGVPLDPRSVTVTYENGRPLPTHPGLQVTGTTGKIRVELEPQTTGKYTYRVTAFDREGHGASVLAHLWVEREPFDLRDTVIYQVMVDRFRREGGATVSPPKGAGHFAGGNLKGVLASIESGEFQSLGVNTLWLSPLYGAPKGTFSDDSGHEYEGYHGYWPADSRAIDPRFGTDADFDAVVSAAHARSMRVILDVVPHHVHEQNPVWARRASDRGFLVTNPLCICGQASCDWGRFIESCWFAPYLPNRDWNDPTAADEGIDDLLYWVRRYHLDGVRIDAIPMMPRSAVRRMTWALRQVFEHPGHEFFLLGENFTGPQGFPEIRYHLGPFGLRSQFHFPLMWTLREAIAHESTSLRSVVETLERGEWEWAGSGAVMSTIIGNHDVTRFASESAGDAGGDGWTPAPQSENPVVYQKQRLAQGLLFLLPGAPVLYYGDEVGLAGRRDPDVRRVMPGEDALSEEQRATRNYLRRLGRIRACSESLRRGNMRILQASDEVLVLTREAEGADPVLVVVRRRGSGPVRFRAPSGFADRFVDALSGQPWQLTSEWITLDTQERSLLAFFPATSSCLRSMPGAARADGALGDDREQVGNGEARTLHR